MVLLQIGMLMTPILACGWEFVASMEKYKCCKSLLCDFSFAEDFLDGFNYYGFGLLL